MSVWTQKGATLSDKSARKEFDISQEEIIQAIRDGKLQYRQNHIHGNPYLRLVREEVENLVIEIHGKDYLQKQNVKKELKQVKSKLNKYKREIKAFEKRKIELLGILGEG